MASIGNYQEAYTITNGGGAYTPYTPYGGTVAERIQRQRDNYTAREAVRGDLSGNYASRIEDLERTVGELRARIFDLEDMLWGGNDSILERLKELEKSAGFSYVDIK